MCNCRKGYIGKVVILVDYTLTQFSEPGAIKQIRCFIDDSKIAKTLCDNLCKPR